MQWRQILLCMPACIPNQVQADFICLRSFYFSYPRLAAGFVQVRLAEKKYESLIVSSVWV